MNEMTLEKIILLVFQFSPLSIGAWGSVVVKALRY